MKIISRFILKNIPGWRIAGSIPIDKNYNYINHILFGNHSELHILLSPEGQLKRTERWKKGFYYMATSAGVSIVVGYIDYKRKEIGVKNVITNISDYQDTIDTINDLYQGVKGKYPEKFSLDKRYNHMAKNQSTVYQIMD